MAIGVHFSEGSGGKASAIPATDRNARVPVDQNPFSTDRVLRVRYRLSTDDWKKLFANLAHNHGRGAFVGPKGSGKTTLLEDLAIRLRYKGKDVSLIRLSSEFPHLPGSFNPAFFGSLTASDAVLLDGAEQLSFVRWLKFRWQARRAGFVVVTTPRAGWLRTLHRCRTSPALLGDLASALGQALKSEEAEALHRRHRGDIRGALLELRDRYAKNTADSLFFPAERP